MRLGENSSALLEWLHLEALGIRVALQISLITLGGCHNLDSWSSDGGSTWVGDCLWPPSVIVRGVVPSLVECQKITLVNCSCHWVTSLVGRFLWCPIVWMRFVQHLLATDPPSVGRHNRDYRAGKHVNIGRKIGGLLSFGILPVIDLVFILWLVHSSMRRYNHLTYSFTYL